MPRTQAELEKVPYAEAREWFWVRTAVWSVPAYIISATGAFSYAGTIIEAFKTRLLVSLLAAFGATLLGVVSARISTRFPWMRLGLRKFWWLNGVVTALIAAFGAAGLSAFILAAMRGNSECIPGSYTFDTAQSIMLVGVGIAGFWGAAFGTWFALRFDRYFVESF